MPGRTGDPAGPEQGGPAGPEQAEPPGLRSGLGLLPPQDDGPYAHLLARRVVMLGGPVDDASVNVLIAQLLRLDRDAPDREIQLCVNSPGGSFTALTALHDTMRHLSCDVRTVCLGQAGPAAAVLLAAGRPGKRLVLPGAHITLQQPSYDEPLRGRASDLEVHAAELLRRRDRFEELLARYTGRPRSRVHADLEHTTVLDAQQAVTYGLVDRVAENGEAFPASEDR
ncbi:ATP-dependent Clp protease proteolytic subunit [Streptantibioticus parmotrematis]|uniref:ATP-dependent Clp protease proteolytic subunit n=1 Tax=Streptantibioticus parmotrematis TaxID=2873249 RepID=UPI0033D1FA3D